MTQEEKAKAYDEAIEKSKEFYILCKKCGAKDTVDFLEGIFPELKESEDERMLRVLREGFNILDKDDEWYSGITNGQILVWLEKQGNIDLEFFENGENEKREFVGYSFLKCKGDFLSFKEGETYWLEYVGKDNYNVRSDNLLGQTFHITPQQLYTVFRPTTWLEKQGQVNETIIPQHEDKTCKENNDSLTSEDERIRKALKEGFKYHQLFNPTFGGIPFTEIVNWLEKQGEQKTANNVEPKFNFKIGDWVIDKDDKGVFYTTRIEENFVTIADIDGDEYVHSPDFFEVYFRLWSIQDAKDGDVLASGHLVFIFKVIHGVWLNCHCSAHNDGSFIADSYDLMTNKYFSEVHPATKEQRDLLFKKIKEAGYEWDIEKKELKMIESFNEYEGLTDFEKTLADICSGWIGNEIGWKEYIKDNANVLLRIAFEKFKTVQDTSFK